MDTLAPSVLIQNGMNGSRHFAGVLGVSTSDQEVVLIREDLSMARSRFFGVPDLPWGDDQVVNLSLKPQMGKVVVQPVTANPKVRHLISVVDARIVNTKLYLLEVPEACTRKGWRLPV